MAKKQPQRIRIFGGNGMTWISPVTLKKLLEAKVKYPQVPVVMRNTSVGMWNPRGLFIRKHLWGKEPHKCIPQEKKKSEIIFLIIKT